MMRLLCAMLMMFATMPAGAMPVGRILSYVRSNRDGSEAERIHVYRASRTRIEVTKMRERCTNAAFVTADLDVARGQAVRLTGGRLRPAGGHRDFAWMEHDRTARRITARFETDNGMATTSVAAPEEPWHLYDFDLASLTATLPARRNHRALFGFGLALAWNDGDPREALRWLGHADARFTRVEMRNGRRALRFQVSGPAFGNRGGPLWLDAREGFIVGAAFGIPNHAEYRDFALRLTGMSHGSAAWRRLLAAHFEGCPTT